MKSVITKIKKNYKVIDSTLYGNGETLILEVGSKNFAVCLDAETATIYQCFQEANKDWTFLPSSKTGKTFKTVEKFINSRI